MEMQACCTPQASHQIFRSESLVFYNFAISWYSKNQKMFQKLDMLLFSGEEREKPPVVWWSEFLAANPEVPGAIPGATRFSE
jgi:hypothetical protein